MISVVIPIYNVAQYLSQCVDSVLSQSYQDLEIILVDDGATDDCPRMCDEYEAKDSRVRVIHKKNERCKKCGDEDCEGRVDLFCGFR